LKKRLKKNLIKKEWRQIMNWTIGKKMFLAGVIIFVGLSILAGNGYRTNSAVQEAFDLAALRNEQMDLVNKMKQSLSALMLAAMDSIVDKDAGKIDDDSMKTINESTAFIEKNLGSLFELADTAEEKQLAKQIQEGFPKLAGDIKVDLVKLIEEGSIKLNKVKVDFIRLDDELDGTGDPIKENLAKIFQSVQEEQKEATDLAVLRNRQMALLTDMVISHGGLMLAAMDSIVDKGEGKIEEGRMKAINESVAFMKDHLDDLVKLADTGEEKKSAENIRDAFPKLARGIQRDLVALIERRASDAEFERIDDVLDNYGDPIEEELVRIFRSVQEEQKEATELAMLRNQQMALLNDLIRAHGDLMLAAMDTIIDKQEGKIDEGRAKSINASIEFIHSNLDKLVELADTGEEKQTAESIRELFPKLAKGIQTDLKQLIEEGAVVANKIAADFVRIDDVLDEHGDRIEEGLAKMVASVQEEQKEAAEASSSLISSSTTAGLIVFFITLAVIIPVFLLISRSITRPLTRAIETLAEGSDQVASASGQVSASSQSLAEGASEQAASIEETSSSLEEMASMTKQNANNASEADNLMKDANQVITQANDSMGELTSSMEEISKASEETSKIIKTIDEIAFQTNLLALNAAVEAARAGEAGAGFAVVADEVRNLAMRAADAAKNTADLIEGTVKKVKDGSELVAKTNEAFTQVAESVGKVGELVGEIAAASNEQAQGIEQVNKAVVEMDKVVQQNAANAEESASAAEEMTAQTAQVKGVVVELGTLVGGSKKEVGSRSRLVGISREEKAVSTMAGAGIHKAIPAPAKKVMEKEVKPDEVIPMDNKDF
jgi:ABC-type transporter Mla subunit MlaD